MYAPGSTDGLVAGQEPSAWEERREEAMTSTATPSSTALPCKRCGSREQFVREQTFRDGSTHSRVECANCGRFIRYAPRQSIGSGYLPEPIGSAQKGQGQRGETNERGGKLPPRSTPTERIALPTATTIRTEPASDLALRRCQENVDAVDDAFHLIHDLMRTWDYEPPDVAIVASVSGALIAASANLSMENIQERAERLRR
jgi:hypothetical protein